MPMKRRFGRPQGYRSKRRGSSRRRYSGGRSRSRSRMRTPRPGRVGYRL